jgi:arylsulfatase A-like enzyme
MCRHLFFLLASLLTLPLLAMGESPPRLPNVIVILADDLGFGDVSCNGTSKFKTPNIDRLAKEGLNLTSGYAPSSTCTPSRYSFLTGEYAWRKKGTGILPGDSPMIISPTRMTVPRLYQKAGYATAAVGKWHLGLGNGAPNFNEQIKPGPNELGFSYSYIMAATGDRVPCVYLENGRVVNLDPADPITVNYRQKIGNWPTGRENPELLRMKANEGHADTIVNGIGRIGFMTGGKAALWNDHTMTDTFTAKSLDFIKQNKDKTFFLFYAAHEPHVPRDPNPRFIGKSGVGQRGDAILQFDETVGKILDLLKQEKIDDQTLVVLTSDNGPAVADGYADEALADETKTGHHANGTWRGGKYSEFEGGNRVPFLARWPGRIKPGTTTSEVVCFIDWLATSAALTNQKLDPEEGPDSFNILPVLTDAGKSPRPFLLLGNPDARSNASAIREGKWKLILKKQGPGTRNPQHDGPNPTGLPLMFDLEKDPKETTNIASTNPEVVKHLQDLINQSQKDGFSRPGGAKAPTR